MRKIVSWLISSLDGVVEQPESWGSPYLDDEVNAANGAGMAQSGAVLLGRRTYQDMVRFWPHQGSDVPWADWLNDSPKHVVSATLTEPLEWKHSTLVKGDVVEEVTRLKREPGDPILVLGSPMLVRTLLGAGLVDELTLNLCPIVLGSGLRLFDGTTGQVRLDLVGSTAFGTGLLAARYRPAAA
jgi:dihydrofolate reductase